MQKRMQEREAGDQGFTLIELLVVIIIIGILAAIAIPAFLNQRQKAWASQVESDLKNAAIAAESYAVGNNGSYDGLDATVSTDGVAAGEWDANGFNGTADVSIEAVVAGDGNSYTLTGENNNLPGESWTYTSTDGKIEKN
ncbi:prepilin-type N-terminal cleavage/methylation domain-containing protein [Cellulomonas massiliensis]|uniref:prepilin-type N-terminal cleavage/methylation domain-containing protein n=1 Tax=Cellulomonas massiliensis TaxID=1465811 RepID=UPI0002D3AB81